MSEITITDAAKVPAKFKPEEAKKRDAQADAVIEYAKKIHDWPMLEAAIDQKMKDQTEFIQWWKKNVRDRGRPS